MIDGGELVEERERGVGHRLHTALVHVPLREVVGERIRHVLPRHELFRVRQLAHDAREEAHAPGLAILGAEVGRLRELGTDLLGIPRPGFARDGCDDAVSHLAFGSRCATRGGAPVQQAPASRERG